jgi:hypothetical protein
VRVGSNPTADKFVKASYSCYPGFLPVRSNNKLLRGRCDNLEHAPLYESVCGLYVRDKLQMNVEPQAAKKKEVCLVKVLRVSIPKHPIEIVQQLMQ